MTDNDQLAADFQKALLVSCETSVRECKYNLTYFRQMVIEQGGVQAAKKLVRAPKPSDGLTTLWMKKRLDLSMEAIMLHPRWRPLFTEQELAMARNWLEKFGYSVPSD